MTVPPPDQPPPDEAHEGSEDDPRREVDHLGDQQVIPPRRYGESNAVDVPTGGPAIMDRVVAASIPLATLAFFAIGFGTGMWWVAWVVFLIPPALRAWLPPSPPRKTASIT